MQVPFSYRQFMDVFRDYNQAIWPSQIAAYLVGTLCVIVMVTKPRWHVSFVLWALAAFWVWNGIDYHWAFFRQINPAAAIFAALFVAQAVVFAIYGCRKTPEVNTSLTSQIAGWTMVAYAMVGYALVGRAAGHGYPAGPVFGVAPCPTTIFTFGMLTLLGTAAPRRLLAIPAIWALIGTSAAISLGMREDFGLPMAAILAIWVRLSHGKRVLSGAVTGSVPSR